MFLTMKKTKILCTIGPASRDREILKKMYDSGMDAVRINTSHGDFEDYTNMIKTVRSIGNIPILIDTKGPEVRIKCKKDLPVVKGDIVKIGFSSSYPISFDLDFRKYVKKRMKILVNDGLLELRVIDVLDDALVLKVMNSEVLINGKSINLPKTDLHLPILGKKDQKTIDYLKTKKVEFVAVSFTSRPEEIRYVRKKLASCRTRIIAKIENFQGVKNIDKILPIVDGIMIARGDLGVEVKSQKLPIIQKNIIKKCNNAGKLVITATQMLKSMVSSPVPSRAETSDIANAILDGTDVVMLSEESAIGKYPIKSVQTMSDIAHEVEPYIKPSIESGITKNISKGIAKSIFHLSEQLPIKKIVTITRSGYTARMISRFRLNKEIIAVTRNTLVRNQLGLYFGITPILYKELPQNNIIPSCAKLLFKKGLIQRDDLVLFTSGKYSDTASTNLIQINKVSEIVK